MSGEDDGAPALAVLRTSGVVYELEDPITTVGRSPECDIVLRGSRSISSRHARIVVKNAARRKANLEDLGSLNGCFVNDSRVQGDKMPLKTGDMIKFGYDTATYMFEFPADKVAKVEPDMSKMPPHLRRSVEPERSFMHAAGRAHGPDTNLMPDRSRSPSRVRRRETHGASDSMSMGSRRPSSSSMRSRPSSAKPRNASRGRSASRSPGRPQSASSRGRSATKSPARGSGRAAAAAAAKQRGSRTSLKSRVAKRGPGQAKGSKGGDGVMAYSAAGRSSISPSRRAAPQPKPGAKAKRASKAKGKTAKQDVANSSTGSAPGAWKGATGDSKQAMDLAMDLALAGEEEEGGDQSGPPPSDGEDDVGAGGGAGSDGASSSQGKAGKRRRQGGSGESDVVVSGPPQASQPQRSSAGPGSGSGHGPGGGSGGGGGGGSGGFDGMTGFGMMMDDEEDEGGDQAAPPEFGDEDDEESLMVPSPQPHGEHKGSEHAMTPIVESPMQRNPMPFHARSGSARALHGGGGTSGGSGTMDLTGGGDAAGEGTHTAVGSANQGAKPGTGGGGGGGNPLLGTGGELQERGFASKESLRSDPSKPAPPPMDARAIQAEASLAAEKDLTIAQQGHVVQNLEHNMDVLTASVADKEAKLKALQERLDTVKRELNTQLARKDDELKQLRSVHKATIESMAAKATRELMELKQAKRRVDVENRQLGQSIKLKEQQMSDMRALNKAATRNAAMLAMQRWCMRVQGRGLQRAWRVWLIATLKDKVRASRTRESAMATSMREAQTQLQMLMHNDWARELVRQGEEIKTLHQELEDAKERNRRERLDYANAKAGVRGDPGPAQPAGTTSGTGGGPTTAYPAALHPESSAHTRRLVAAAVADSVAVAQREWQHERGNLMAAIGDRDRQIFRLTHAVAQVAQQGASEKRKGAAGLLVSEVQRLQQREKELMNALAATRGPHGGQRRAQPPSYGHTRSSHSRGQPSPGMLHHPQRPSLPPAPHHAASPAAGARGIVLG